MAEIHAHIGREHYRTQLTNGNHTIVSDELVKNNGTEEGPSPHDILMMSLAACTAITLRMYADRKEWNLEGADVKINMLKEEGKTRFERSIMLTGDLTDEQRKRLLQIADACPVHKTLTHPIEIETTLI